MPTQTGTLKAGNQLVIDSIGSLVDYDVSVTGYAVDFKRIQQKNTLSLGPYKVDCSYSVTINTGSPSIYKVQPNGQREYTSEALPDTASLAVGAMVNVDGDICTVKKDGLISLTSVFSAPRRQPGETSNDVRLRIQNMLDACAATETGGVVRLENTGAVYPVNSSLVIGDNTTLDINGAKLVLDDEVLDNIIVTSAYKTAFNSCTINWSSGLTCTVNDAAHSMKVGDYISLNGGDFGQFLGSPSQFLGVFRVNSVTATSFSISLWRTPTSSPSGTFKYKKANINIKVCNGSYKIGAYSSGSPAGSNALHGIIAAFCHNLIIENIRPYDVRKYTVFGFGLDSFKIDMINCQTNSDGVHIFGPARGGVISNITGKFGDDSVALSSRDWNGNWVDMIGGDLLSITVVNTHGTSTTACNQIYSHAGFEIDDITYKSSSGDAPNHMSIYADALYGGKIGNLTLDGGVASSRIVVNYFEASSAGFTIKELKLRGISFAPKSDTSNLFITGVSSVAIEKLVIEDCKLEETPSYGSTGEAIAFLVGCSVRNVEFRGGYYRSSGNGAILWKATGNNNLRNMSFIGTIVQGFGSVYYAVSGITDNPKISVDKSSFVTCGKGVRLESSASVSFRDCTMQSLTGSALSVENSAALVEYNQSGSAFKSSAEVVVTSGSITGGKTPGGSCDITKCNRVDGSFIYNTNASANNGVDGAVGIGQFVCIGTAQGSWKRLGTSGGTGNQY